MGGILDPTLLSNLQSAYTAFNTIMQQVPPVLETQTGDSCDDYLNTVLSFAQSAMNLNQQRQQAYNTLQNTIVTANQQIDDLVNKKIVTGPQPMSTSASEACGHISTNVVPSLDSNNNPLSWPDGCAGYYNCPPGTNFPGLGCHCGPWIIETSQSFLCQYSQDAINNARTTINNYAVSAPPAITWPVNVDLSCAHCDTNINAGGNISGNISVIQNCKTQFDNNPNPTPPPTTPTSFWEKVKNWYTDPETKNIAIGGTIVGSLTFLVLIILIARLMKK